MRGARGQATVDYLAVVLVVAGVMAAAVGLLAATGLGSRVFAAFRHALCVVTGGPCDEVAVPCVTSSAEHVHGLRVSAMIFRLGHREVELREHRSDGRETVTLVSEGEEGLDFGTGVGVQVRWGSFGWAVGSELRAAVLAEQASGRAWTVADDAAATRLVGQVILADRTRRPAHAIAGAPSMVPVLPELHAPAPDETFREHGGEVALDGQAGRVGGHVRAGQAYGERLVRSSGRRTIYVRSQADAGAGLSIAQRLSASGELAGEERYGVTYDRAGRPLDFEVLSASDLSGSAGLSPQLARLTGRLSASVSGGRHVETEQHLDLTDPDNAALVKAYLGAFGTRAGLGAAAHALRERLDRQGSARVRTYASSSTAHEVSGQARLGGVGVGGETGSEDSSEQLVSALVRGPGGTWRPDPACRPV